MVVSKKIKVKDLIPYEDNSRVIDDKAIDAVASSIKTYGYNVPILVDTNNVIIAGHTRRLALMQLKVEEVLCMVVDESDEVVKDKMRLLDNTISEASSWDELKLGQELRMVQDLGNSETWSNFSDMFGEGSLLDNLLNQSLGVKIKDIVEYDIQKAEQKQKAKFEKVRTNAKDREVICPKCKSKFTIRVYDNL